MDFEKKLASFFKNNYSGNEGLINQDDLKNLKLRVVPADELYPPIIITSAKIFFILIIPCITYHLINPEKWRFTSYILSYAIVLFASIITVQFTIKFYLFKLSIVHGFSQKEQLCAFLKKITYITLSIWVLSGLTAALIAYMNIDNCYTSFGFSDVIFAGYLAAGSFISFFISIIFFIGVLSLEIKRMGFAPLLNNIMEKISSHK